MFRPPVLAVQGLYLHIPFCFHKCHYCDFYSIVLPEGAQAGKHQRFTERLVEELRLRAGQIGGLRPATVFVGGGTPTLLAPECWATLLAAMRGLGVLDRVVEFTVEANPETVTPHLLDLLVAGGVNRMSMGCQSFHPGHLKTLERWHDPASVAKAAALARRAGIANLNLDLIFAIPGQTLADLDADLDQALALGPDHLSYYNLTYEPNTAMSRRLELGQFEALDEDTEQAMYARVLERLAAGGFEPYEVSNWARAGGPGPCRHNVGYWHNRDWLACGPGGASHAGGQRWKNVPNLGRYLEGGPADGPPVMDVERLEPARARGEQLMLRLRLMEGAPLDWLDALLEGDGARRAELSAMVEQGFLERTATHLRLTRKGLFVADALIEKLL